jgi:hypothetical protein
MKKLVLTAVGLILLLAVLTILAVNVCWSDSLSDSQSAFIDDDSNDSDLPEFASVAGSARCLIDDDPNEPGPESTGCQISFIDDDPNEPAPESTGLQISFIEDDSDEPEPEPEPECA